MFRRLFSNRARRSALRRPKRNHGPTPRRIRLEPLEDRQLLSVVTWDGEGATDNWSEAANWVADTLPNASDTVVFDATSIKNAVVDAAFGGTIQQLQVNSGYAGTVNLERDLTVNGAFTQQDGVFDFGVGLETLAVRGAFTVSAAASFNAGDGTVEFQGGHYSVDSASAFNDVVVDMWGNLSATQMDVDGDLTILSVGRIYGTVSVAGDVTTHDTDTYHEGAVRFDGTGDQQLTAAVDQASVPGLIVDKPSGTLTIDAPTTLSVYSSWLELSGTVQLNVPIVEFKGGHGSVDTPTPFNDVIINKLWNLSATQMDVDGDLTILSVGRLYGTVSVAGDVTTHDTNTYLDGAVRFDGTGDQQLTAAVDQASVPGLIVDKPSGTLTIDAPTTLSVYSSWLELSGTVQLNVPVVEFKGGHGSVDTPTPFNDVIINKLWNLSATQMDVDGDLTILSVGRLYGTVSVAGDVTTHDTDTYHDGAVRFDGTGDQQLTAAVDQGSVPGLIVDKPSGTLTIDAPTTLSVYSSWLELSGTVQLNVPIVEFKGGHGSVDTPTPFNDVIINKWGNLSATQMDVDGDLTILSAERIYGLVVVAGDVTSEALGFGGDGSLIMDGSQDAVLSADGAALPNGGVVIDKDAAGTNVTLGSDVTVSSMRVEQGTLDLDGRQLTVSGGTLVVDPGGTLAVHLDASALTQAAVTGSITLGGSLNVNLVGAFVPAPGDAFTIVDNDQTDAVSGTFAGLAEGANLVVDGTRFQMTYTGGTGNDVVLTANAPPVAQDDTGATDADSILTMVDADYAGAVLAHNPFAYWRLNEASGPTAVNIGSVGSALDGAYNNEAGFSFQEPSLLPGGEDASVRADGATTGGGTEVRVPDHAALNLSTFDNKTVELWFNASSITSTRQVIYEQGAGARGINVYVEEIGGVDTLFAGAWNLAESNWGPVFASAPVSEGTAYHVVFVLEGDPDGDDNTDDGVVRLYLDGAQVGTDVAGAGNLRAHGGNTAAIGVNQSTVFADGSTASDGLNFAGTIDEVALYNDALNANEVSAHYQYNKRLTTNDTDPNAGDTLTVTAFDALSSFGAAVNVSPDGTFTYDPTASASLSILPLGDTVVDTFTYTISDGEFSDTATVSITVTGTSVNAPPSAYVDTSYTVDEGGSVVLDGSGSTDPDQDPGTLTYEWDLDGDAIFGETGAAAERGDEVGINPTFSADGLDGPGTVTVDLRVTDDGGLTDTDTAAIEVQNVDPAAVNDSAITEEDLAVVIPVLANDSDVAGAADPLAIDSVSAPAHGTAVVDDNGTPLDTTDDRILYTPDANFAGTDTFEYTISDGDGGSAASVVNVQVQNLPDLSGRVFDDLDNDGLFEPGDGETGIEGVTVTLTGTDDQETSVNRTALTAADGSYTFDDLRPGTYSLSEEQPAGFLDGDESVGTLGGTVDNTQDSNLIDQIMAELDDPDSAGYDFAEIRPSDALGIVWEDFNNDGEVNFGEKAIEDAIVELTGTDDRGNAVGLSDTSDADGIYMFIDLRPGNYTIAETQPAGFEDGVDSLGTVNGAPTGDASVNDQFSGVVLPQPGSLAENYNFGERPQAGSEVTGGQTATIGFWQNKNGQELIRSLTSDDHSTDDSATNMQLADWLAATFPNMYGIDAAANNLAGKTNAEVADFYKDLFRRKKKEAVQLGLGGPVKVDAQVMAVALATYVTNVTLAGTTAADYGFVVTEHGVGSETFNVGDNGQAFGAADYTDMTVLDILMATNDRTTGGVLYDQDGDGDADDNLETLLRTMANDVYSAINEQGDI